MNLNILILLLIFSCSFELLATFYEDEEKSTKETIILFDKQVAIDTKQLIISNLQNLEIKNEDVASFKSLSSLTNIIFQNNHILFINDLSLLINITYLKLYNCGIVSTKNIVFPINLLELDLSYNQIENIDISNLRLLKVFTAECNSFTSLEGKNFPLDLIKLNLSSNDITYVHEFSSLKKLEYLDLSDNKLTSIDNFTCLINLKNLSLSYNQIVTVSENIINCKKLEVLDISNNKVSILAYTSLQMLPQLKSIYANRNTITELSVIFIKWIMEKEGDINFTFNPIDVRKMGIKIQNVVAADAISLNKDETERCNCLISLDASIFKEQDEYFEHYIRMLFYLKNAMISLINKKDTFFEGLRHGSHIWITHFGNAKLFNRTPLALEQAIIDRINNIGCTFFSRQKKVCS